jgi:hypothetical protein
VRRNERAESRGNGGGGRVHGYVHANSIGKGWWTAEVRGYVRAKSRRKKVDGQGCAATCVPSPVRMGGGQTRVCCYVNAYSRGNGERPRVCVHEGLGG